MASRKRSHDEDNGPATAKRRNVSTTNGSPAINGDSDQDEPVVDENLELFRKEAIYRKMKHYSRELGRSQNRVEQLELRKNTCEAGLAAISACWSQLIDAMKLLTKSDDQVQDERVHEAFNVSAYIRENPPESLSVILDKRKNATQALITRFIQLGGANRTLLNDSSFLKLQSTTTECAALRSQVDNLESQLQESKELCESLQADLSAAENRCLRLTSKTVTAIEGVSSKSLAVSGDALPAEPSSNAPPPSASAHINGDAPDGQDWAHIAGLRQQSLDSATVEIKRLKQQLAEKERDALFPPAKVVQEQPSYLMVLEKISHLNHTITEMEHQVLQNQEKAHQADEARRALETQIPTEYAQQIQDLKTALARRDADIARIRESRDQQLAELNERRQKDSVKNKSILEVKQLSDSRADFISVLQDRLRLCKSQLASAAGNEDLMKYFLSDQTDASYVEDLKSRLETTQRQLTAYQETVSSYDDNNRDLAEEHRITLEKLAEVQATLSKYQAVYGTSSLSSDASALAEELQRKNDEINRLRLDRKQRQEAETSLYNEIDKVSAAWEELERQVSDKVSDLEEMEDKLSKCNLDRAKAENKWYQAMREKEASDAEQKSIQRLMEKQDRLIQRLKEDEANLKKQLVNLEQEHDGWERMIQDLKAKLQDSDNSFRNANELSRKDRAIKELVTKEQNKLLASYTELEAAEKQAKLAAAEAEHEVQRLQARLKVARASVRETKPSEVEAQLDDAMALLKCSTCKQAMRNTMLTKCSHTFCKQCIDTRISTRQRKCPSCNLPFTGGEVLSLYFQ
ncbi:hypothetical protein CYLTODRAFT_484742 [Cylindrobasidium torrendii FP15055 ss-10]|uniref:E3 ubiquitin protein ligase n=1 Tax=Cylindrobasidium torrendii FP15055 ss-10 TaxID=1314674 RepID=A0A0D7BXP8_9AGAR|nr:hypothetical protein CYLTODRAFT_484742 [Cylindrobasidium torrendii FP15055 ss-10]